jgi:hypothetical protein
MKTKFYHVSHIDNAWPIALTGLEANEEGEIPVYDTWWISPPGDPNARVVVGDMISLKQVGSGEYIIVEIDPRGIRGELIPDDGGDVAARFQFIVKQKQIARSYCKVVGRRKVDFMQIFKFNIVLYPGVHSDEFIMQNVLKLSVDKKKLL